MRFLLAILLLFGPAAAGDSPRDAVEQVVAAVKKAELRAAYEQLGDGAKKLLDEPIARMARTLGMAADKAAPADVLAALETRLGTEEGKQFLAAIDVTVVGVKEDGDRARVDVRANYAGKSDEVTLLLVRRDGAWILDGADAGKARARSNETAAIATLRNITSAQAQFQATARADANRNGNGEYGFFGELSGAVGVRGGAKMNPPVLSRAFQKVEKGVVTRSGYHYRIFLPGKNGDGLDESADAAQVDAPLAESTWCCYAWPVEYGRTGKRTFFINQMGDILAVDHDGYSGAKGPGPDAAFEAGKGPGRIVEAAALDAKGADGNRWSVVR